MKSLLILNLAVLSVTSTSDFTLEDVQLHGLDFLKIVDNIQLNTINNVSPECFQQINSSYYENANALIQMADSWSKFPYPGAIMYSSTTDWGNYDECVKVDVKDSNNRRMLGKYCPWGFYLPFINTKGKVENIYALAYCVPDKCSADDLSTATGLNRSFFEDKYCSSKNTDSEIDTGAIVAMIIFGVIFACSLASTVYDIYLHYTEKKASNPLMLAFSFFTHGKKLLQTVPQTQPGDQILCFQGMKFISMWWIISGHGFISWFLAPVMDSDFRTHWQTERYAQYIASAHICVDTFFYISGFLFAYLYFKQELSKKSIFTQIRSVPMMVVHRYLRLTPAYGMCFLGVVYLFKYTQDGPFFSYGIHTGLIDPCKKYWWTYFTYIQNYYNFHKKESLCVPTTWYLSADMQLFLITPLILIPISQLYKRSFWKTMMMMVMVNIFFFLLPIYIRLQWRDYDNTFQEYDFHSKLISYFIGVMMGIFVRHEKHKRFLISRSTNLIIWFFALGTMLAVIFYRQDIQIKNDYVARSLCYSFTRPMWCLSLCWITFACIKGYGGVVNWFLSSEFMQMGGKLTYCIYITHGFVIAHYALGNRNRLDFNDWNAFYQNCGYFIISLFVATFWTLSYEAPMLTIEKAIFG